VSRWSLRRRLVAVLIALVALLAVTMGVVSTMALRGSLIGQLDQRVLYSSERALDAEAGPRRAAGGLVPADGVPAGGGRPDRGSGPTHGGRIDVDTGDAGTAFTVTLLAAAG
jgi:two-component system, OmpR family, sensor kinase